MYLPVISSYSHHWVTAWLYTHSQLYHHTVFVVKQLVLYSRIRVCMCVCAHVHICRELTKKPHVAGNISDIDVALLVYDR